MREVRERYLRQNNSRKWGIFRVAFWTLLQTNYYSNWNHVCQNNVWKWKCSRKLENVKSVGSLSILSKKKEEIANYNNAFPVNTSLAVSTMANQITELQQKRHSNTFARKIENDQLKCTNLWNICHSENSFIRRHRKAQKLSKWEWKQKSETNIENYAIYRPGTGESVCGMRKHSRILE